MLRAAGPTMGGQASKRQREAKARPMPEKQQLGAKPAETPDARVERAFRNISDDQPALSCRHLTEAFGEDLGSSLWKFLSDNASEKTPMDLNMFSQHFVSLMDPSTLVRLLMPAERLIRICAQSAGVDVKKCGEELISSVSSQINADAPVETILAWKKAVCPRICDAVIARTNNKFFTDPLKSPLVKLASDVLSVFQCWFLQCCLPDLYFTNAKLSCNDSSPEWPKLYSSFDQGLSSTKFDQTVFNYRAPTVTVLRMCSGEIYVVALDQEWRNSGAMFGSTDCNCFQLTPSFRKSSGASSVYCNLSMRKYPRKLSCRDFFSVDEQLNGVDAFETFGCGSSKTLREKCSVDERQKQQIERNKRVPLPGKWDENADKTLLELAGVYSTENRREVYER